MESRLTITDLRPARLFGIAKTCGYFFTTNFLHSFAW